MVIRIDIYKEIDPDLRDRWLTLWERNSDAHPFNHPAWFKVAPMAHKGSCKRVIVASREGRCIMFLMASVRSKKMTLLGSPYLDKASILADQALSGEDWQEIVESLLDKYHQISIQEISRRLATDLGFDTGKARSMTRASSLSPFFEVERPCLSGKRRHEARRYTRKLDKDHGPMKIDFTPLNHRLLEDMADIEGRSTKPDKGRAEFENRSYFDFLTRAIDEYGDMCWIGIMSLDGNPVAHYAGMVYGRKIIGLHMAFDMKFSRYSPGTVLIFNLLPMLKQRDIELFEFGRGQSVVKTRFAGDQVEPQDTVYFFKKSLLGTLGLIKARLVWACISLGRRIRARDMSRVNRILDRLAIKR